MTLQRLDADTSAALAGHRLDQERRNLALTSIRTRDGMLRAFARWLNPRGLLEATREDVEAFLDGRGLAPNSRYAWISHLHGFYDWAADEGLIPTVPRRKIKRPKVHRNLPRPIGDADLAQALSQASTPMRAMLCLAAYQGLRCVEIAGLRREDVHEDRTPAVLMVTTGKGGRERILALHPETLTALHRLPLPRSGWVFPLQRVDRTSKGGRHFYDAAHRVSMAISVYLRGLDIPASAHMLRHWFGTSLYGATHDLRLTQELMGHQSPITTAGYTAWSPDAGATAIAALRVPNPKVASGCADQPRGQ
jgi:integrase